MISCYGFLFSLLSLGAVFGIFGGYYYYSILVWNKLYNLKLALIQFYLILIGVNITFFRMLWLGLSGLRRRYFDYNESFNYFNKVASFGSVITLMSVILMMCIVYEQIINNRKLKTQPYSIWCYFFNKNVKNKNINSNLELQVEFPILTLNFEELPCITRNV